VQQSLIMLMYFLVGCGLVMYPWFFDNRVSAMNACTLVVCVFALTFSAVIVRPVKIAMFLVFVVASMYFAYESDYLPIMISTPLLIIYLFYMAFIRKKPEENVQDNNSQK
jgi:general stress protein CsbA